MWSQGSPMAIAPRAAFWTAAAIAAFTASSDGDASSRGAVASMAAISPGMMAAEAGIAAEGASTETARAQAAHPRIDRRVGISLFLRASGCDARAKWNEDALGKILP